jgi:triosephosphate isomerase
VANPIVAGNWKMNTNLAEAVELAAQVRTGASSLSGVDLILCPPFVSLAAVREEVKGTPVSIGAQNMHHEDSGAFTGEIAPPMLVGLCDYVILGHSERRQLFGETNDLINAKVKAAVRHGLRPILCVGETAEQRESGRAAETVSGQLEAGLAGVVDITALVVAYEPVWAIGTGLAATPEIAADMMGGAILETLTLLYPDVAAAVPLLYGGSVNPGNVSGFAAEECIQGALVGGASLRADQFLEIAQLTAVAKGS